MIIHVVGKPIDNNKSGKSHFNLSEAEKGKVIGVVIAKVAIIYVYIESSS